MPTKDAMTTVIIQNHHQKLIDHHQGNPASKDATPNTQAFIVSAQHLVQVGSQSIIQNRDEDKRYLGFRLCNVLFD
jgi:hypothetical protein